MAMAYGHDIGRPAMNAERSDTVGLTMAYLGGNQRAKWRSDVHWGE